MCIMFYVCTYILRLLRAVENRGSLAVALRAPARMQLKGLRLSTAHSNLILVTRVSGRA